MVGVYCFCRGLTWFYGGGAPSRKGGLFLNFLLPTTFILSILVGICDPLCIQKCPDLLFCNAHRYFLRNNLLDSRTFNNFVPQHVRIQLIIASYALKQLGFQNLFIVVVVVVVVVVVCIVFVLFVNTKIIVVVVVLICLAFVTGRKVPNIRQMTKLVNYSHMLIRCFKIENS